MADTLSRKHRLKQHEQQQQQFVRGNQQNPYGKTGDSLMKNGRMTGAAENDNDDYDAECFQVFKVVEVGTNTCHEREEFCSTRTKLNNNSNHNKERLQSSGSSKSSKSRITAASSNFKGENVNVVRDSGQIERRNESHFDHFGSSSHRTKPKDDYNHNHHPHHWREHSIYDDGGGGGGSSSINKSLSRARKTNQNHRNHATATNNSNHQLSKTNLSSLNGGSSTTKSIGGSSSSGFSSSNGSGSSYTCSSSSLQQQQLHSSKKQQADCVAQTGSNSNSNNNNGNKQRGQFYGHDRGMAGKRSKLIDDLDRLLMPPAIVGGNEASSLQTADNNNDRCRPIDNNQADELRRRRSSLVSPTESHISTATNSSQHPSILGTGRKPNFNANDTANDFDYSTLCRDEFSSFIQIDPCVTPAVASKLSVAAAEVFDPSDSGCGPMLVGVHETESSNNVRLHAIRDNDDDDDDIGDNVDENVSDGLESDDLEPYEEFKPVHYDDNVYEEIPNSMPSSMDDQMSSPPIISTSPSCSAESPGCDNNDDLSSPIVCQNYSPETLNGDEDYYNEYCKSLESTENNAAAVSYSNLKLEDNCEDLSRKLDVYVEKVNSLIRLTKSDKSISIHEAFKSIDRTSDDDYRDDYCFEVRADHRTPVAFVAHQSVGRENSMRIIQEVEYENEDDDQRIGAHDRHRTVVTHVSDYNSSLLEKRICQNSHRPLKSILESIQISPELCWSRQKKQQQNDACDIHSNDLVNSKNSQTTQEDIRFLEESLITRLSGSCDNDRRKVPVAIIKEHLREFIENYHTYQRELSRETSFADGSWHENWLFASKRPRRSYQSGESATSQEVSSAKRARLSNNHHWREQQQDEGNDDDGNEKGQSACQMEKEQADLIKYSTLILAKCKPVRLTLSAAAANSGSDNNSGRIDNRSDEGHHYYRKHADFEHQQNLKGRSDTTCHIESLYEAQLERVSELELVAIESSRQTDVCRLLLHDTDEDDDDYGVGDTKDSNNNKSGNKKKRRRPVESSKSLLVSYGSTSLTPTLHHASKFYFTAAGYLFQTSLIRFPIGSSKLRAKLESRILNKLISCVGEQSQSVVNRTRLQLVSGSGRRTLESERARFVISLSNLELINRLPVIQFCAKISGSLPIRVRWFRQSPVAAADGDQERYEELSDISAKRKNLNIKSVADKHSHWPIELQSSYDYEYQTPSASWLRFRRNKDDILFEIREPNFDTDYNRVYKCLIENACSRRECKFQLTTKRVVVNSSQSNHGRAVTKPTPMVKSRKGIASRVSGEDEKDGHALLRTWSQRTLNKPQPTEPKVPTDADRLRQQQTTGNYEAGFLAGTSGRQQTVGRLSASSVDEDKFGKNFPYHPENLLKRLEENKFSIPAKRKLVTTAPTQALSTTMNDCHLTQNESMFQESSAVVAESMCSDSKILIDADVAAEHYYPKQPQSTAREQLALANNNSGLNSTHADLEQPSDSHRLLFNNSNKENNFGYSRDGDDASERLGLRERPRAVINPRPFNNNNSINSSGSGGRVDDSTGRLKANTQQSIEKNDKDNVQQVPIQQPKPRRRQSQTVINQDKELDRKENFRPNEHNQTNQDPDSQALPGPLATDQSSEGGKHSNQPSAATASEDDDVNRPNGSPSPSAPASNRQKLSGSNVKSLISRFSMA